MDKQNEKIIDMGILFDKRVSHAAARVYFLIDIWTKEEGYCWARNKVIADQLGLSEDGVSQIIQDLASLCYLKTAVFHDGEKNRRHIYTCEDPKDLDRLKAKYRVKVKGFQKLEAANSISLPEPGSPSLPEPSSPSLPEARLVNRNIVSSSNKRSIEYTKDPSGSPKVEPERSSKRGIQREVKKTYSKDSPSYGLAVILLKAVASGPKSSMYSRYTQPEEIEILHQNNANQFNLCLEVDKRDPNELLDILLWSQEDPFWSKNILSAYKFRCQYNQLKSQMLDRGLLSSKTTESSDHNPEITKRILKLYRNVVNNPKFEPNSNQYEKFVSAAAKMVRFFKRANIEEEDAWFRTLALHLEKQYIDYSKPIYPGTLCSDLLWEVEMPQVVQEMGCYLDEEERTKDVGQDEDVGDQNEDFEQDSEEDDE